MSKTHQLTEEQTKRVQQYIQLREAGHAWEAISKLSGLKSKGSVHAFMRRHARDYLEEENRKFHKNQGSFIRLRRREEKKEKQLVKELYNQFPRLSYEEIINKVGRNAANVISKMLKTGELTRRNNYTTPRDPDKYQLARYQYYMNLRRQGKTWKEIANIEGLSRQAITSFVTSMTPIIKDRRQD